VNVSAADSFLTACRQVLAYLRNDAATTKSVDAEFRASARDDELGYTRKVMWALTYRLAEELKLLAALEPEELKKLTTRAAKSTAMFFGNARSSVPRSAWKNG
jgi:hypothetical protein